MSYENLYYYYGKIRHYYQSYLASNIFNASLIIDNIYIGNVYDAYDIESLKNQKVMNVLSAVTGFENIYDNQINHLCLQLIDNQEQNIIRYFEISNMFINKIIEKKQSLLIHCIAGRSRSVTLLIAYLIYKYKYTVDDAISLIKKKRPIIEPNQNFIRQLNIYYDNLYNKS
tara:strand:+ start:17 stop:529 length:513 start_codon:yes stop_codon:yes gene_type:complete